MVNRILRCYTGIVPVWLKFKFVQVVAPLALSAENNSDRHSVTCGNFV